LHRGVRSCLFKGATIHGKEWILRDADVQLSAQRLQELMLWHGKDEGNLPPAVTLVNLSRDTIAALSQLQHARIQVTQLRAALAQIFWTCNSSAIRAALLAALGPPPDIGSATEELPAMAWHASPNGLPPRARATEAPGEPTLPQRATG
jgi:hypothetical protein